MDSSSTTFNSLENRGQYAKLKNLGSIIILLLKQNSLKYVRMIKFVFIL